MSSVIYGKGAPLGEILGPVEAQWLLQSIRKRLFAFEQGVCTGRRTLKLLLEMLLQPQCGEPSNFRQLLTSLTEYLVRTFYR